MAQRSRREETTVKITSHLIDKITAAILMSSVSCVKFCQQLVNSVEQGLSEVCGLPDR